MAGYSGKPLVQKLGIKPGFFIFAAGFPGAYEDIVGPLPTQAVVIGRLTGAVDMIHVFAARAAALGKLPVYREAIKPDGMVWVSWPKKSSGVATDVTEAVVRETGLAIDLFDVEEPFGAAPLDLEQRSRVVAAGTTQVCTRISRALLSA